MIVDGRCPQCRSHNVSVVDTKLPRRRRLCQDCGHRYWTLEIIQADLTGEDIHRAAYLVSLMAHLLEKR